ncbi:MAG TPA: type II toxin-antitoxin system RelE/ParE family toxin [Chloroflexota bacterium]|jgi:mRNA-degrading endonuclease RelE of RelBE toxin-antitoxin system
MPWKVAITRQAQKDLDGLPVRDRSMVEAVIQRLADDPGAVHWKKLGGYRNRWRVAVGRWRIIVAADNRAGQLTVLNVFDRKDAYRD